MQNEQETKTNATPTMTVQRMLITYYHLLVNQYG